MAKDICISCGAETAYDFETHIDVRIGYVEGVGQLCSSCYNKANGMHDHLEHFLVSSHTVKSTPNDMELGAKVRKLYYESKDNS